MPSAELAIIAAVARNRVIGLRGAMPWHLPEDLKRFKRLTMGAPVIMGRKTFESILATLGKPLPGRRNLVITRSATFNSPGAEISSSLDAALESTRSSNAFVIGGAEIYRLALPLADSLHLTEIDRDYEGDTWFPEIDTAQWCVAEREDREDESGLRFSFVTYRRTPNLK
jgi:dihydrofolate reductase